MAAAAAAPGSPAPALVLPARDGGKVNLADLKGEVSTREKHLYSIYSKMLRKAAPLSEIVDVFGG